MTMPVVRTFGSIASGNNDHTQVIRGQTPSIVLFAIVFLTQCVSFAFIEPLLKINLLAICA